MDEPRPPESEGDPKRPAASNAVVPYAASAQGGEPGAGDSADASANFDRNSSDGSDRDQQRSSTGDTFGDPSRDPSRDPPRDPQPDSQRDPMSSRLIVGLVIAAFGALLFLGNLDLLDVRHLMRTIWPLALVAVGVSMVRKPKKENSRTWGWVLVILGGWWFLDNLGWVGFSIWQLVLPTILLAVGGMLVWRTVQDESSKRDQESLRRASSPGVEHTEFVRSFAFMSYCDLHPALHPFRGGDVTAVMGGVKLDLRDTVMHGDITTLDVFAFWGGIEILVPPDWIISSRVTPIIGGFVDNRRPSKVIPNKTLIIQGFNLMSGVEVKN